MITKIKENVYSIEFSKFGSIVYLIQLDNENILIDTGAFDNRQELINSLKQLKLAPKDINLLILTHRHYDHIENIEIFLDAKIYGSKEDFQEQNIIDIDELKIKELKIIKTPGHTKGSFCILYQNILFSGDTIFHNGYIGRTDFPESNHQDMINSLGKLKKVKFKILCPGH